MTFRYLIKKYWVIFILFVLYQLVLFYFGLNSKSPIPYLNFIFYFSSFLLIHESLGKTRFNKILVFLFYFFYGFLSIVISLSILTKSIEQLNWLIYLYLEIILSLFIIIISIYLVLYSIRNSQLSDRLILYLSIILGIILTGINYYKQLYNPFILSTSDGWNNWVQRNNIVIVLSILFLIFFWYCYYQKRFVVSEYLNSIIFLFTFTNMIEALNFIAFQWNVQIWFKVQFFIFIINILMIILWYMRLVYLNSDIALENERYLMNFQFLNGFVSKPKKSGLSYILSTLPINSSVIIVLALSIVLVVLFTIKKISFYLLLNTIFILLIVMTAFYFSFVSIKRDWHNQFDILFKKK